MVTLPKEFVATKYPGYFFNITDERLYSVKVTGMLKPLAKVYPNQFNHFRAGFSVSIRGQKRVLEMSYLKTLKPMPSVFPVYEPEMK